jgi:nicotinate phosphoribosyltransferase
MANAFLVIDMLRGFMDEDCPLYCGARPIDFTADLHEVDGKPIAKRGRIPGITPNPRLRRVF